MSVLSDRRLGWVAATMAVLVAAVVVGVVRPGTTTVHAATPGDDTITVTGVGTADATPDTLTVDFTVHVTRSTVQEALDGQAGAGHRVLGALRSSGVPRNRTQTTDLSLDRHYDRHGNVTGYDANETVRAKVRPLSHAGRAISRAATSAGNAVSVGGLAFDLADDTDVVKSARANPFADAQDGAPQYASLCGRGLGRVEKVTEVVDAPPEPVDFYAQDALRAGSAGAAKAGPLRAGEQMLTVRVNVTWALA